MKTVKHTLDAFCKARKISREWLASPDGHLKIDGRTKWLPEDELVVGGNLEIVNSEIPLPPRLIVGGNLQIRNCRLKELPAYLDVKGDMYAYGTNFSVIHEGCHFHKSVTFSYSHIRQIHDYFHVAGNLELSNCPITVLPKGLAVDKKLCIQYTNIQAIPADCRCKALDASYSMLKELPENWSVEYLNVSYCPISEFPIGVSVSHVLDISYTGIREIQKICPGVSLNAFKSKLSKLPDHCRFRNLYLSGCPITVLPKGLMVQGVLYIDNTQIESLPADSDIRGGLFARFSALRTLPDHLVVEYLNVRCTQVSHIPAGIICGSMSFGANVKADCYLFSGKGIDFHPNGKYVRCDQVLSKVEEHKGNVWRCKSITTEEEHFIITDGEGF